MNKEEAIETGREWLEHSPPFNGVYHGPHGMRGLAGFICRECCKRIIARGCNLKAIASEPEWEQTGETCDICEQTRETSTFRPENT